MLMEHQGEYVIDMKFFISYEFSSANFVFIQRLLYIIFQYVVFLFVQIQGIVTVDSLKCNDQPSRNNTEFGIIYFKFSMGSG